MIIKWASSLAAGLSIAGAAFAHATDAPRTVYITIDDSTLAGFSNIFSVLDEGDIPASIFMVGLHVEASSSHKEDLKRAIASPSILIGNHSYSHAHEHYQHFYSDIEVVLDDMRQNNEILGLTQKPFHARLPGRDVFRLPGLSSDDPYITTTEDKHEKLDFNKLQEAGFFLYGWDLEWAHETSGQPIQSISKLMEEIAAAFDNHKTEIDNHLVLLMHDQMFADHLNGKENFSNMVTALKAAGYRLATLESYPGAQGAKQ